MTVITRFAPSPTGLLHVGNVRTALINWLYARSKGGKFILRIDDTDRERSTKEYEDGIKRDLEWLGLDWDETTNQSDRMDKYEAVKQKLIDLGRLYPCYETPEELEVKKKMLLSRNKPPIYDREALKLSDEKKKEFEDKGIQPHWRFLMEDKDIEWEDEVRGHIHFKAKNISDPVLVRADGTMTYSIASVLDDIELGITHIIRGEDHISNSAIHVQMFEALGAKSPNFSHVSLLKSKEGEMSKRVGGFDIAALREAGLQPVAIISFLAKLGTSDPIEYRKTVKAVVDEFSMSKFSKSTANYDVVELERINTKLIHHLDYAEVKEQLPKEVDENFWEAVKPNLTRVSEINDWQKICNQALKPGIEDQDFTKTASELLPEGNWDENTWGEWVASVKEKTGRNGKDLFMPIRLALTGMTQGPELKNLLPLLGREKAVARLNGKEA